MNPDYGTARGVDMLGVSENREGGIPMKRMFGILMLLVLLVPLGVLGEGGMPTMLVSAVNGEASGLVEIPVWTAPAKTMVSEDGAEFSGEDLGRVVRVCGRAGGWFCLTAPADGDYVFSVRVSELSRNPSFCLRFCGEDGEPVQSAEFTESDDVQSFVLRGIRQGERIRWWDDDNTGRGETLCDSFELMISVSGAPVEDL